jgi:hypothetical protein
MIVVFTYVRAVVVVMYGSCIFLCKGRRGSNLLVVVFTYVRAVVVVVLW